MGCVLGTIITTTTACGTASDSPPPPTPSNYDNYCAIRTPIPPFGYIQSREPNDSLNKLLAKIVKPEALTKYPLTISPNGSPDYNSYKVSIYHPTSSAERGELEKNNLCVSNWSWQIFVGDRYYFECRAEIATKGVFTLLDSGSNSIDIKKVKDNSLERNNNNGNVGSDIHTYCGIIPR